MNQFLLLVTLLYLSSAVAAQGTITLDFNSLPSAQGWTYINDGAAERSIFSVNGGVLTQNTLAGPFTAELYSLPDAVNPLLPYTISIRARVIEESGNFSNNSFGFCFGGRTATEGFAIGIGTHRIEDNPGNVLSTTIDNTQFHDYRLVATPGVGYSFFVDDVLVATGLPLSSSLVNSILLGDCTRGAGAHAEITAFTFSQQPTISQTYDAAADFSTASNPNGVWSYGYELTLGGSLILYTATDNLNGIDFWRDEIDPNVSHNGAAGPVAIGSLTWEAGQMGFHPGPNGEYSVVRWTAPSDSQCSIQVAFAGFDHRPTTTDVHVLLNGISLFDGVVVAYGLGPSFATTVNVTAGDTIDFAVGFGPNGDYTYDSTALSAIATVGSGSFTSLNN